MSEKYGRKVKRLMIDEMKDLFAEHKGFFISSLTNISATEIGDLRAEIRKAGSRYFVLKNRLARIAMNESDLSDLGAIMEQHKTLGIGFVTEEPVAIAKKMKKFADDNDGFEVFSGYLEGEILSGERVDEISKMPSREQLLANLVSSVNAPVANFVGVMSTMLRNFVYVIDGIKKKKEEDNA